MHSHLPSTTRAKKGFAGSPPDAMIGHRPSRHGLLTPSSPSGSEQQIGSLLRAVLTPHAYRTATTGAPFEFR